jgi:Rieske Fe-S protein
MLVCPCHESIFDPSNDVNVVKGPTAKPLAKTLVEEDDKGGIYAVDIIGGWSRKNDNITVYVYIRHA